MKIALINPNQHLDYPQPHLGLLSIAGVSQQQGHGVMYIDANAHNLSNQEVIEQIECVDMVGITATSLSYPAALELAKAIRQDNHHRFMVLGGIHGSLFPDEVIKEAIFDAVVIGEGERLMPLVSELRDKGIYSNHLPIVIDDIQPLPYWLLDGFRPRIAYGRHQEFMPILTARGCPYNCSFCSNVVFGKKYREQSVVNVLREIDTLRMRYGVGEIKIYDDVFTMDKSRAIELSQRIAGSVAWSCMTRVNLVDRNVLKNMKLGGCYSIAYGLESGDAGILKSISKNTTLEQGEAAVRYAHEAGIRVIGYFMLGALGETLETINKTIEYAIALKLDHAQFSITAALPGSELYNHVPEAMRANSYALPGVDSPSLCELSPAQLQVAQAEAYKKFKKGK